MTVYADVLIVINLFVNYALLSCASLIMKNSATRLRIFLGAAVGSVYGLIIFAPELPHSAELAIRLAASCLIVFCTFGYKNIRYFLRCFFTFFAVSFAFGGIMLVLWVTVAPVGMVYNNGVVYYDINIAVLAVSTIVCFAIVSLISHFIEKRAPKNSKYNICVEYNGNKISGTALCDTGNSLKENFSGFPVIVGEYKSLEKIIPTGIENYFSGDIKTENAQGIRLIVHSTVSGMGILPAFRPDEIEINGIDKKIRSDKVYIAVTKNNLASGEYDFIISPEIFEEENNYAAVDKDKKSAEENICR